SQDDLTDLGLLRFDLIAAIGVGANGLPADVHLAHILPPNPQGRLCDVWASTPFHAFELDCLQFIESLEAELARVKASHVVKDGYESAILISASKQPRADQEDRLEELAELVGSDGIEVL